MSAGLPWIRLYRDITTHPKLLTLECLIGPGALAHVVKLWCAAATHYRDGRILGPPGLIARYAGWSGPPEDLLDALVESGLFQQVDGGLACHNWDKHQGAHIDRMESEAARGRVRRASAGRYAGRPQDGTQDVLGVEERRGEEKREDKKRQDQDQERASAPAREPDLSKPIWAQRLEPISAYGPIPDTLEAIMAFEWRGEPVLRHLKKAAPELSEMQLWDQAENCLNYRGTTTDLKFRSWYWPDGCLSRMVAWLTKANSEHCNAEAARARLAKTGAYVADTKGRR